MLGRHVGVYEITAKLYGANGPARGYDVTKDGQRFFLAQLRKRPPDVITEITVVQNWTEELKKR